MRHHPIDPMGDTSVSMQHLNRDTHGQGMSWLIEREHSTRIGRDTLGHLLKRFRRQQHLKDKFTVKEDLLTINQDPCRIASSIATKHPSDIPRHPPASWSKVDICIEQGVYCSYGLVARMRQAMEDQRVIEITKDKLYHERPPTLLLGYPNKSLCWLSTSALVRTVTLKNVISVNASEYLLEVNDSPEKN